VSSDVVRGDLRSPEIATSHSLVFHAYINEMHDSRSKIPVKISSGSVARRVLIPALNG
jgi:hypothetical protein